MATDPDVDTSRTVVQVYVPAYQRDVWDEHADELDMSRSEFVKTMVQAGRRGFGGDPVAESPQSGDIDPSDGSESLRTQILESLEGQGCLSWDDLLAAVTGDIETQLEETLQELQEAGQVRYSGREGGYVLETEENE
ncbi:hypothetical protein SAMN05216226_106203 [Halovenus aranensis]|uniref:Uncharacterized protein n=1 Tax=Halovenus aranensis TaxID=890420 RepID=A0A1G8VFQ1_9EURY|nr:DUF5805 domain-containing protein [Halovenus aranensis]SDJ64912.1 hypothetical protein SAMN05216226_106203 [Halovenus aranensis]